MILEAKVKMLPSIERAIYARFARKWASYITFHKLPFNHPDNLSKKEMTYSKKAALWMST